MSKQRQEYKNLLRGRTTRLDENRIRLLNSVGFAWQLQRGGRRRQLKARKAGEGGTSDDDNKKEANDDESSAAILPGEVLIGHGAPSNMSSSQFTRRKSKKKNKSSQDNSPALAGMNFVDPSSATLLQQQGFGPNAIGMNMGMHMNMNINRNMNMSTGQQQDGNGDLVSMIMARNALLHNLQRGQGQVNPQMFFGGQGFSGMTGMQDMQGNGNPNSHLLDSIRMQSGQTPNNFVMPGFNQANMFPMGQMGQQFPNGFPGNFGMTGQMPGSTAPAWLTSAAAQARAQSAREDGTKQSVGMEQEQNLNIPGAVSSGVVGGGAFRNSRSDPPEVRVEGDEE